ncbi:hypothetical protein KW791_00665 [Candidatus Parcubacteria bacterium]|nr:hypothetical protein [Candidatus Parcubacteria bacterium]
MNPRITLEKIILDLEELIEDVSDVHSKKELDRIRDELTEVKIYGDGDE